MQRTATAELSQNDGVTIFHIRYWHEIFAAWRIARREVLVRYHPEDLSRIFVSINGRQYIEVRCADLTRPGISLWEHRAICRILRGHKESVSEASIFQAIETQWDIVANARAKTRLQRQGTPRQMHRHARSRGSHLRRSKPPQRWTTVELCSHSRSKSGRSHEHRNLSHLLASTRAEAVLHNPVRLRSLRRDRWIDYSRANQALQKLEHLLDTPPRERMPCMVLHEESNIGKTHIIAKFQRNHPDRFDDAKGTNNRSVAEWGGVFGDAVVATAILDRLLHHSHVITIRGDSYRLRTPQLKPIDRQPRVTSGCRQGGQFRCRLTGSALQGPSLLSSKTRYDKSSASRPGTSRHARPCSRRCSDSASRLAPMPSTRHRSPTISLSVAAYSFKFAVISFFDTRTGGRNTSASGTPSGWPRPASNRPWAARATAYALAETINGLYKAELIHRRAPWKTRKP